MKRGKKAALELSIGTIVIIVLAMSMLILGIVLVRKIMCSGVTLTDKISKATESEISSLFDAGEIGVKCMGEEGREVKLGGGGRRQVICIINTQDGGDYEITYKNDIQKIAGNIDATRLVVASGWKGKVSPGKKTVTVAVLNLPREIPNSAVKLSFDIKDPSGNIDTHTLFLDLVPASTFSSAIC